MSEQDASSERPSPRRGLLLGAWVNVLLWLLSVVAFVVALQADSPKGLFVLLAAGLMTSLVHAAAVRKAA